jgi:2-polyprenyl-3-methyl-5-hydroxy-6-metoxy-1,4-benzoquinol methylase
VTTAALEPQTAQPQQSAPAAIGERVFSSGLAGLEVLTIALGQELGYYRALATHGALSAFQLAAITGTDTRYAREWLEQQAVAGIIATFESDGHRHFWLSREAADALVHETSPAYLGWITGFVRSFATTLPRVAEAYRDGTGVPYADFGPEMIAAQAAQNRPAFTHSLVHWFAAIPGVDARLQSEPGARVADIACGVGWSTLAIARHYPWANVDGIDIDEASLRSARCHLRHSEHSDRVRFIQADAATGLQGRYDVVTIFEALHDMARPVEVLSAIREHLADDGMVIVMDEKVAEEFAAPGDEAERIFYAYSVLHCLPAGRCESPSAETGAVMRPDTLRRYAAEAGYMSAEVAAVDCDDFRFYVLRP